MAKRKDYYYLPKEYHLAHDYSEFILLQIEELLINKSFDKLRLQKIKLSKENAKLLKNHDGHIYDFFIAHKLIKELNHSVQSTLLNSLIMDVCYFLQEGYLCSLKMRLSVSFTLFRKPFMETLIICMRLALETDFIDRFNNEENFDATSLSKESKLLYLETLNLILQNKYNTNDLFDYLFNKEHEESLYLISNHAIHLYTDRNKLGKTGKQNLNFIFSLSDDINVQWEYIYSVIPMLLNFLIDVIDLCVVASTTVPTGIFEKRFSDRDKMRKKCEVK
jgi:hypothetical protein